MYNILHTHDRPKWCIFIAFGYIGPHKWTYFGLCHWQTATKTIDSKSIEHIFIESKKKIIHEMK